MEPTATRNGRPALFAASAAPTMPRLSASVPPEVKTTSRGSTPSAWAIFRRAASTPARAVRPNLCAELGFPHALRGDLFAALGLHGHGVGAVDHCRIGAEDHDVHLLGLDLH